jgi:hypothetical protein
MNLSRFLGSHQSGDSVVFSYPKNFIHISVSQATDHLLIREQHLMGTFFFPQISIKISAVNAGSDGSGPKSSS